MGAGALQAKNFVLLNSTGVLSSVSASHKGYPFGSAVPYDVDPDGRFVIFISLLSEHYKNLAADSRAGLLVLDTFGYDDPQAHGRASILTRFIPVEESELEAVSKRYFERFPSSTTRSLAHNFRFYRGELERMRWIGGFGDIRWIEASTFRECPFDEVCYHGMPIISHMNTDHRDALQELADWKRAEGKDPIMCSLDSRGFRISLRRGAGRSEVEIAFLEPVTRPDEVRGAIIALLERCRSEP